MISHHSLTDRDHFFPKLWTIISLLIDCTNFYHDSFIVSIVLPRLAKFFSLHSAALKVWKTMNFNFKTQSMKKEIDFDKVKLKRNSRHMAKAGF